MVGSLSTRRQVSGAAFDEYISDPAKPGSISTASDRADLQPGPILVALGGEPGWSRISASFTVA
jgi:hypothetical protein